MPILQILTAPDKILRQKALPISAVDAQVQTIMQDMLETMYFGSGIGLAANQVGILKRIIVIDIKDSDKENRSQGFYPLFMANPIITFASEEKVSYPEGCLSLPEQEINVERPKHIIASYLDMNNQPQTLESSCLLARVIQHEIDHLDGIMIIDYVSKLKKDMIIKRLNKIKQLQPLQQSA